MNTYIDILGIAVSRFENLSNIEISMPHSNPERAIGKSGDRYIYHGILSERAVSSMPGEGSSGTRRPNAATIELAEENHLIRASRFVHQTNSQQCVLRRDQVIVLHDEDESELCTLTVGAVNINQIPVAWAQRFVAALLNGLIEVAREKKLVLNGLLIIEGGSILEDSDWTFAMVEENEERERARLGSGM